MSCTPFILTASFATDARLKLIVSKLNLIGGDAFISCSFEKTSQYDVRVASFARAAPDTQHFFHLITFY